MRILEETKDYVIEYDDFPQAFVTLPINKMGIKHYYAILEDKHSFIVYYDYQEYTGNFEKDIISLGKKLIKQWKKEKKNV